MLGIYYIKLILYTLIKKGFVREIKRKYIKIKKFFYGHLIGIYVYTYGLNLKKKQKS